MLYRVVSFLVLIAVATADDTGDFQRCTRLFEPTTRSCCMKIISKNSVLSDDLNECFDISTKPPLCEKQLCIAKKKGFANPDGTLNKKALADKTETFLEDEPELLELIKDNCLNGNIDIYGPHDLCEYIKMENCISVQYISQCNEFSNKAECSGLKELAEDCVKLSS